MQDVIVVGGGFAGVAAAREAVAAGRSVLLVEARDRLGGRTWSSEWHGEPMEYGGQYVHWHQPHTFTEISRAGIELEILSDPAETAWWVGDERRIGTMAQRDEIARRGWDQFVDGVERALPLPHSPLAAISELARFDRISIAERLDQLDLGEEERDVLAAELESVSSAPLEDAGAVAVLRWHALSGYSLWLTQFAGGRVSMRAPTRELLESVAAGARCERRLGTRVVAVRQRSGDVELETEAGELMSARAVVVAVPLNVLSAIEFEPQLSEAKREAIAAGQASRGVKLFIRARGEPVARNTIRPGHPFGYLTTEELYDDGSQLMLGFGLDAGLCAIDDLGWVQRELDRIVPGYEVLDATMHDWLADEYARGTWAVHRPGWYEHHHAAMQRPEGRVVLASSDIADGWSGFIDGALESGMRAGRRAAALTR
jgi:glycine/D-amino acid oxidase-like deaminating enzyme